MDSSECSIAGMNEVRQFWTRVMNEAITTFPIQYSMKASEMLARSYGMFRESTEKEKKPDMLDMSGYSMTELREMAYSDNGLT